MKKTGLSLFIIVVSILLIGVVIPPLTGRPNRAGSPERPVPVPMSELAKIMDARGSPRRTASMPPVFFVTLNNQSDWHITSLEIRITSKSSGDWRSYVGDPIAYRVHTGEYDAVGAIKPKSAGYFLFQICPNFSWQEMPKKGTSWEKEYVFEPYEWMIVRALGYRR